jgi:hypothetical protein
MRFPVLAAIALALLSLGMTHQDAGGPRAPITAPTGPHGFPTGPRGFSTSQPGGAAILFTFQDGRLRLSNPFEVDSGAPFQIRIELPALSAAFDEGAVAASAEIVPARNPRLISALATAATRAQPGLEVRPVAGELYLRIRKPAAVGGLRADVPTNVFAAWAMRPVPDRVFRGRKE